MQALANTQPNIVVVEPENSTELKIYAWKVRILASK
jgi:hypothetical protein